MKHVQPKKLIVLGDCVDFYQLSRFISDPGRKLELQADLDAAHVLLRRLREASPRADMRLLAGNHEARLRKHLWGTQSPLSSLRNLEVSELLRLKELRCSYAENGQTMLAAGALIVKHGNAVRAKSGYSATAELERAWLSGISGHVHRAGQVFRRNAGGTYTWIESGCLCGLDPEYAEGQVMDWAHAVTYAEVERGGNRFTASVLPIIHGRIVFGGGEICGRKSS